MTHEELHQRLRAARKLKFKNAYEAADAMGVARGTYYGHENGSRGDKRPDNSVLQKYAAKFGVNILWLAHNRGPMTGKTSQVDIDDLPEKAQDDVLNYVRILRDRHNT